MKLKKIILTMALALSLGFLPTQQLQAATAPALIPLPQSDTGVVSPLSHVITWRYKVEDGKIYKRLFNATTQTYIGEWIYVGEYNP